MKLGLGARCILMLLAGEFSLLRAASVSAAQPGDLTASVTSACTMSSPTAKILHPVLDFPMRAPSICRGHDDWYYLTGTTGFPDWDVKNDGIWVWRSEDLNAWERIGKVWDVEKEGTWQKELGESSSESQGCAVWAPEIHYFKETYWISYAMNWGGTGLLRSKTGKIAGPYEDLGKITDQGRDASIFVDDNGKVFWIWQDGRIALMKDDMTGLAEKPKWAVPAALDEAGHRDVNATRKQRRIGSYGAFLRKISGKYWMFCSETFGRMLTDNEDVFVAVADSIYGPYSRRYLVLPHGGQSTLFQDKSGKLCMTYSGDKGGYAAFTDRLGLVPMEIDPNALSLRPTDAYILESGPVGSLKPLVDFHLRDPFILADPKGYYTMLGTPELASRSVGIRAWQSQDLRTWTALDFLWTFDRDATWSKEPPKRENSHPSRAVWAPELHFLKGTYWIPYSLSWRQTGLLKSITGKLKGPYVDVTAGPLTEKTIHSGLFVDDDGTAYCIYQGGMLARMKDDMSAFAETPKQILDAQGHQIGSEGAFLVKIKGQYVLGAAQWHGDTGVDGTYDLMYSVAKDIDGPYGPRRLAVPHGGHGTIFKDLQGQWQCTFFGHDRTAPFRARPGLIPLHIEEIEDDLLIKAQARQ
jgi:beta-xylosidase